MEQQAALSPATTADGSVSESESSSAAPKHGGTPAQSSGGDAWLVQLGSYLNEEQAQKGWGKLSSSAPDLLSSHQPIMQETRLSNDSVVWRVRLGPYSAYSEAAGMCEQLKSHGLDCYVAPPGS